MDNRDDYMREDPLRVGRGIFIGVALGALIWAVLLFGVYAWIRWM